MLKKRWRYKWKCVCVGVCVRERKREEEREREREIVGVWESTKSVKISTYLRAIFFGTIKSFSFYMNKAWPKWNGNWFKLWRQAGARMVARSNASVRSRGRGPKFETTLVCNFSFQLDCWKKMFGINVYSLTAKCEVGEMVETKKRECWRALHTKWEMWWGSTSQVD